MPSGWSTDPSRSLIKSFWTMLHGLYAATNLLARLRRIRRQRALLQFGNVDLDAIGHDDIARLLVSGAGPEPLAFARHLGMRQIGPFRCHCHGIGAVETAGDIGVRARGIAVEVVARGGRHP